MCQETNASFFQKKKIYMVVNSSNLPSGELSSLTKLSFWPQTEQFLGGNCYFFSSLKVYNSLFWLFLFSFNHVFYTNIVLSAA